MLTHSIKDLDLYLFHEGTHTQLYQHLGAHACEDGQGYTFATWAPNATEVHIVGDFNHWTPSDNHKLTPIESSGIFWGHIPEAKPGDLYKLRVTDAQNQVLPLKSDPFGRSHETSPKTASILTKSTYAWKDKSWMERRKEAQSLQKPISVYELHLGSWKKGEDNRFLTYREIAPLLVKHLNKTGFTHVEMLPIMEHPFYGSWGYQCTGYFAPTSRHGTPDDFKFLVDTLHKNGFGIILDWVPSHFPEDDHGLHLFDGTHLFDHADARKGFHPDWKSRIFNYDRHEVRSFLLSSAHFWVNEFHIDGLRVDAVASMLYLDYSRNEGEWIPNIYGGRENLGAIHFLKRLNELVYQDFPDIHIIAEESTAWPQVTGMTSHGGLGFGMKWDMGWMHDTLQYMQRDPIHRVHHHNELTFRAVYAQSEQYMLSLSHDEVVHGKGSLLTKMAGASEHEKFAHLRLLYTLMYAHQGKKLLFMGSEFGQPSEWNHDAQLPWHLVEGDKNEHTALLDFIKHLNTIYKDNPALYESDFSGEGFQWVCADDSSQSILSFLRWDNARQKPVLAVFNFTPVQRHDYTLGVPSSEDFSSQWEIILNTSIPPRKSKKNKKQSLVSTQEQPAHGFASSMTLMLPGLSALWLTPAT